MDLKNTLAQERLLLFSPTLLFQLTLQTASSTPILKQKISRSILPSSRVANQVNYNQTQDEAGIFSKRKNEMQ